MKPNQIAAIVTLLIGAILGFIGLVIGSSLYNDCSNSLPIWLVAMGSMLMAVSLSACSHIETAGVHSVDVGWFDVILALVLLAFNVYGSVVLAQTSPSECSSNVYQYAEFSVVLAWIISVVIVLASATKFREHIEKQKQTTTRI